MHYFHANLGGIPPGCGIFCATDTRGIASLNPALIAVKPPASPNS